MSKELKEKYALTQQQLLSIQRYFMSDPSHYFDDENGI